jgi:hypothetical protein
VWRLLLSSLCAAAPALAAPTGAFIGAETCKACHPLAYQAWKDGPHAASARAVPQERRGDARCATCHDPDADKGGSGVSCETCHGGGGVYAHAYVMRDRELARAVGLLARPGERTCLACHTESAPALGRFDYGRKLRVIEHGGDRQARSRVPAEVRDPQ